MTFRKCWASRRLTMWFVVLYLLWVAGGAAWGWLRITNANSTTAVEATFLLDAHRSLRLNGQALIHANTSSPFHRVFVGSSKMDLWADAPCVLIMFMEFANSGPHDEVVLTVSPSRADYRFGALYSNNIRIAFPLVAGRHEIDIKTTNPATRYRVTKLLVPDNVHHLDRFQANYNYVPLRQIGDVEIDLGSGWISPLPDLQQTSRTESTEVSYFRLRAKTPGRYRLTLSYVVILDHYRDAILEMDHKALVGSKVRSKRRWRTVTADLDLTGVHLFAVRLPGKIASPRAVGLAVDQRFLAYAVDWSKLQLEHIE